MGDKQLEEKAAHDARKRKKSYARSVVDHLESEVQPVSVFMAGSPGAGKTETARSMREVFKQQVGTSFIHIDNDELRKEFADYNGLNSSLFQKAATIFVEAIHDRALRRNVSFIMDSTLARFDKAKSNIQRSLSKGRFVLIIFVYQSPEQAWELVRAREIVEGRRVPAEVFINQFIESQVTVALLKQQLGDKIELMFVEKNVKTEHEAIYLDVSDIDVLLVEKYTHSQLQAIIDRACTGDQK
ncbi:MAG TPA: AAA family ATPase [Gammaproteobacteria bacterium]|nr:AAA family ATPase [Gammaproteobacteria bacterium]